MAVLALAASWFLLIPAGVGGYTSYVMVDGTSMEPLLHTGDLAVASRLPGHELGDLVVFAIGPGSLVIHRLVDRDPNGEWITQGDNKPARDPWTVADSAIQGTYLFAVPGAGERVAWLKARPLAVAFFAGVLAMAMYLPLGLLLPRRWRRPQLEPDPAAQAETSERTVIALAFTGAVASALALVAMVTHEVINPPLAAVAAVSSLASGLAGALLLIKAVRTPAEAMVERKPDELEVVSTPCALGTRDLGP